MVDIASARARALLEIFFMIFLLLVTPLYAT